MDALFPGRKKFLNVVEGTVWSSTTLNWKAKVVCEPCNNGWMSGIESQHAKPVMTDLIAGKVNIPISQSSANSIALFAFKTAVVLEHLSRHRKVPFFSREVRYRFKQTLDIPPAVNILMAGYLPRGQGRCLTAYHELPQTRNGFELYVCTFCAGHFVFQLVAERQPSSLAFSPIRGFEHLAVPFWPRIPSGFEWPPKAVLENDKDFDMFASRWRKVSVQRPFGDYRLA